MNMNNHQVGAIRLNLQTYSGGRDQPTHPSIVTFERPWNGYRYWMSYTPYPNADGEEENPSIAVSNDLYYWETPHGMVNPIANNEETGCDELKDPHILFRPDLNRLEVWYLGRISKQLDGDGTSLTLFRKVSTDGIHWSSWEVMGITRFLCPSVYWNGSKYQMWAIGFPRYHTQGQFVYQESLDGKTWTDPVCCCIGGSCKDLTMWHGSMTCNDGIFRYVYVADPTHSQEIRYLESTDGIHFSEAKVIVKNQKASMWDHFYRPCLISADGEWFVCYGVITETNEWYLSMSHGTDLDCLIGLQPEDATKMVSLPSAVTDTRKLRWKIHDIYDSMRKFTRPELAVFVPVTMLAMAFLSFGQSRGLNLGILLADLLICGVYTWKRSWIGNRRNAVAAVLISLLEGIAVFAAAFTLSCGVFFGH